MDNWKKVAAKKDDSIVRALEILNTTGVQFVVITDDDENLLGAVTDGDIRRGLLKGIQIQDKLEKVMNAKPTSLPYNSSKKDILRLMRERDFLHLPLVDSKNRVKAIISLTELMRIKKKDNHVVLMAGGLGSRLAGLTSNCPKPMLKVGGKPILETTIETFKEHGFHNFVIAVNYMSEMIEEHFKDGSHLGIKIQYLKEKTRLGTAGALSLYDLNNGLPFLVMNGDLLTKLSFTDLLEFHNAHKNDATMSLRQYEHQIPFGVVTTENEQVLKIEEKPIRGFFVNGGIYVLDPKVISLIPKDTYFDMPTLLEQLIETGKKVGAFPFFDYWIDIGRMDDYERAHAEFLEVFK
ncbi:MAG: nucleotidyltransferase family protein, partial [Bdellovibrionota bacterium]